jgi:hypothetical protein
MRDLVAADIDGDDWIAPSDIAAFIAGNGPSQPTPRPMRRPLQGPKIAPMEAP